LTRSLDTNPDRMRDYAAELPRLKPDVIAVRRTNFKHSRYASRACACGGLCPECRPEKAGQELKTMTVRDAQAVYSHWAVSAQ
jgi:hypothetical protein